MIKFIIESKWMNTHQIQTSLIPNMLFVLVVLAQNHFEYQLKLGDQNGQKWRQIPGLKNIFSTKKFLYS